MSNASSLTGLVSRVGLSAHKMIAPALAQLTEACPPSCSSRCYATEGATPQPGGRRVFRRPMRYGSKLAMRDPEAFQRMRSILGYPDDASVPKVERVTISMLQTMKYLMNTGSDSNNKLLTGMISYKVTSLNRDLLPLLDRTEAFLTAGEAQAQPAAAAGKSAAASSSKPAGSPSKGSAPAAGGKKKK